MTNASSWALQYFFVVLAALFAGPLLSKLPLLQAFPLSLFGLNGPQTIRLVIEGTGLIVLCTMAMRAYQQLPDNGRGFSFMRKLILPATILVALIAMDRTLRVAGLPLIEHIGSRRYTLAYTAGLTLAGLWITVAWLLNFDALQCFFSVPEQKTDKEASPPDDEDTDESLPDESSGNVEGGPTVLAAHRRPPRTLGRYKVLKELGRGAMGVVYLGKDPTIQRFVAIKTMRLDDVDDRDKLQEVKTRFFREAESTGRLSHPNIVTIFDAGEEDDLGYIAMELLQGTTLKEWSRTPNLMPLDKLIPILATTADAMDYAHQQGIVHRDIKPANIMLTDDQVVKVMDFGIAKMASSSKTTTQTVMGTPTYMSPEQIAGKKVDGRSDIFSLGVVMSELLTGQPPFTGDNVSAVLFAITNTPHPKLAALRPDLPPIVQDILDSALQKDPVHRYRRAGEFAHDLRAYIQQLAA
jgi:serine/threonine-protein kinase